jgi:branched-subunit amino acid transport protein
MAILNDGFGGYLVLLLIALLAHEPWRWAGLLIGQQINPNGDVFRWVKAVSTSLVAALVSRQVLYPAGALAFVPMWGRLLAFAVAIVAYLTGGRKLSSGVLFGSAVLIWAKLISG